MSYLDLKLFKPFGPSVAKVTIPENIVNELNKYTDQVIKDSDKSKDLNYGNKLVGHVKQEFKMEKEFMVKSGWFKFLANGVKNWIQESHNKTVSNFNLINSWIVRQYENEYNPTHFHGGHVSGVGYLKVPDDLGGSVQQAGKKNNYNGKLELIHGSKMFLCDPQFRIKPKVGDFYFFPHYLMHTVYPFKGPGERRSVSFNATVDEKTFNS